MSTDAENTTGNDAVVLEFSALGVASLLEALTRIETSLKGLSTQVTTLTEFSAQLTKLSGSLTNLGERFSQTQRQEEKLRDTKKESIRVVQAETKALAEEEQVLKGNIATLVQLEQATTAVTRGNEKGLASVVSKMAAYDALTQQGKISSEQMVKGLGAEVAALASSSSAMEGFRHQIEQVGAAKTKLGEARAIQFDTQSLNTQLRGMEKLISLHQGLNQLQEKTQQNAYLSAMTLQERTLVTNTDPKTLELQYKQVQTAQLLVEKVELENKALASKLSYLKKIQETMVASSTLNEPTRNHVKSTFNLVGQDYWDNPTQLQAAIQAAEQQVVSAERLGAAKHAATLAAKQTLEAHKEQRRYEEMSTESQQKYLNNLNHIASVWRTGNQSQRDAIMLLSSLEQKLVHDDQERLRLQHEINRAKATEAQHAASLLHAKQQAEFAQSKVAYDNSSYDRRASSLAKIVEYEKLINAGQLSYIEAEKLLTSYENQLLVFANERLAAQKRLNQEKEKETQFRQAKAGAEFAQKSPKSQLDDLTYIQYLNDKIHRGLLDQAVAAEKVDHHLRQFVGNEQSRLHLETEITNQMRAQALSKSAGDFHAQPYKQQLADIQQFKHIQEQVEAGQLSVVEATNRQSLYLQKVNQEQEALLGLERKVTAEMEKQAAAKSAAVEAQNRQAMDEKFIRTKILRPQEAAQTITDAHRLVSGGVSHSEVANRYGNTVANIAAGGLPSVRSELQQLHATNLQVSQSLRGVSSQLFNMHDASKGAARGLGEMWLSWGNILPMLAGFAAAAGVRSVIKFGEDMEHALTMIRVVTGDTTAQFQEFKSALFESASDSNQPIEQLIAGVTRLAQAGFNAKEALAGATVAGNLALVGEATPEQASLYLAGATSAFGLSRTEDSLANVANVTAKAAAVSQTSVGLMMEGMRQASTVAEQFGVSLNFTAASMAAMAKNNITGSASGTALRNMLTDLTGRTEKSSKALTELGVSFYNLDGSERKAESVLKEVMHKLSGKTDEARQGFVQQIFSERGAKAFNSIAGSELRSKEFENLLWQLQQANENMGFTTKGAQELSHTLTTETTKAFNAFKVASESAFHAVLPALKSFATEMQETFKSQEFREGLANAFHLLAVGIKGVATVSSFALSNINGLLVVLGAAAVGKIASLTASVGSAVVSMSIWKQTITLSSIASSGFMPKLSAMAAGINGFGAAMTGSTAATVAAGGALKTFLGLTPAGWFVAVAGLALTGGAAYLMFRDSVVQAKDALADYNAESATVKWDTFSEFNKTYFNEEVKSADGNATGQRNLDLVEGTAGGFKGVREEVDNAYEGYERLYTIQNSSAELAKTMTKGKLEGTLEWESAEAVVHERTLSYYDALDNRVDEAFQKQLIQAEVYLDLKKGIYLEEMDQIKKLEEARLKLYTINELEKSKVHTAGDDSIVTKVGAVGEAAFRNLAVTVVDGTAALFTGGNTGFNWGDNSVKGVQAERNVAHQYDFVMNNFKAESASNAARQKLVADKQLPVADLNKHLQHLSLRKAEVETALANAAKAGQHNYDASYKGLISYYEGGIKLYTAALGHAKEAERESFAKQTLTVVEDARKKLDNQGPSGDTRTSGRATDVLGDAQRKLTTSFEELANKFGTLATLAPETIARTADLTAKVQAAKPAAMGLASAVSGLDALGTQKRKMQDLVLRYAAKAGLPADIALGMIEQESGFNPSAVSPTKAKGLAQFTSIGREQAKRLMQHDFDPFNPEQAMEAWSAYVRWNLKRAGGNIQLMLKQYNGGFDPKQWKAETHNYAPAIMAKAARYSKGASKVSGEQTASTEPLTAEESTQVANITSGEVALEKLKKLVGTWADQSTKAQAFIDSATTSLSRTSKFGSSMNYFGEYLGTQGKALAAFSDDDIVQMRQAVADVNKHKLGNPLNADALIDAHMNKLRQAALAEVRLQVQQTQKAIADGAVTGVQEIVASSTNNPFLQKVVAAAHKMGNVYTTFMSDTANFGGIDLRDEKNKASRIAAQEAFQSELVNFIKSSYIGSEDIVKLTKARGGLTAAGESMQAYQLTLSGFKEQLDNIATASAYAFGDSATQFQKFIVSGAQTAIRLKEFAGVLKSLSDFNVSLENTNRNQLRDNLLNQYTDGTAKNFASENFASANTTESDQAVLSQVRSQTRKIAVELERKQRELAELERTRPKQTDVVANGVFFGTAARLQDDIAHLQTATVAGAETYARTLKNISDRIANQTESSANTLKQSVRNFEDLMIEFSGNSAQRAEARFQLDLDRKIQGFSEKRDTLTDRKDLIDAQLGTQRSLLSNASTSDASIFQRNIDNLLKQQSDVNDQLELVQAEAILSQRDATQAAKDLRLALEKNTQALSDKVGNSLIDFMTGDSSFEGMTGNLLGAFGDFTKGNAKAGLSKLWTDFTANFPLTEQVGVNQGNGVISVTEQNTTMGNFATGIGVLASAYSAFDAQHKQGNDKAGIVSSVATLAGAGIGALLAGPGGYALGAAVGSMIGGVVGGLLASVVGEDEPGKRMGRWINVRQGANGENLSGMVSVGEAPHPIGFDYNKYQVIYSEDTRRQIPMSEYRGMYGGEGQSYLNYNASYSRLGGTHDVDGEWFANDEMAPTLRKFSKTIAGLDEIFIASARLTEKEMTKYAQDLESKFNNKYYDFGTTESDVSKSKALVDIQKDRYGYLVGQKDAGLGAILTNYQGDIEGFGEVAGRVFGMLNSLTNQQVEQQILFRGLGMDLTSASFEKLRRSGEDLTETFERVKASYVVGNNLDNMVGRYQDRNNLDNGGFASHTKVRIYHNIGDANDRNEYVQNSDGSFSNIRTGERAASTAQMDAGFGDGHQGNQNFNSTRPEGFGNYAVDGGFDSNGNWQSGSQTAASNRQAFVDLYGAGEAAATAANQAIDYASNNMYSDNQKMVRNMEIAYSKYYLYANNFYKDDPVRANGPMMSQEQWQQEMRDADLSTDEGRAKAKFLLDIAPFIAATKTFADAVYSGQQAGYGALMQGRTQGETWANTIKYGDSAYQGMKKYAFGTADANGNYSGGKVLGTELFKDKNGRQYYDPSKLNTYEDYNAAIESVIANDPTNTELIKWLTSLRDASMTAAQALDAMKESLASGADTLSRAWMTDSEYSQYQKDNLQNSSVALGTKYQAELNKIGMKMPQTKADWLRIAEMARTNTDPALAQFFLDLMALGTAMGGLTEAASQARDAWDTAAVGSTLFETKQKQLGDLASSANPNNYTSELAAQIAYWQNNQSANQALQDRSYADSSMSGMYNDQNQRVMGYYSWTEYGNQIEDELARLQERKQIYDGYNISNPGHAKALTDLQQWYIEQQKALGGNDGALALLKIAYDKKFTDIITNGTLEGLDSVSQAIREWANNLKGWLRDKLLDEKLSPLTTQQKFSEASSQYYSELLKADSGDKTAKENITKYADKYLDLARQMYASGADYTTIFNAVTTQIAALSEGRLDRTNVTSGALLGDIFNSSVSATKLAEYAYQFLLGRNASAGEYEGAAYGVTHGTQTANQMLYDKILSPEFGTSVLPKLSLYNQVGDLYKHILGREADQGGLNFWTNEIASGRMTAQQLSHLWTSSGSNQLLTSSANLSNADFVEQMNQTLLGRASGGATDPYLSQLNTGTISREGVIEQLLFSQEHSTMISKNRVLELAELIRKHSDPTKKDDYSTEMIARLLAEIKLEIAKQTGTLSTAVTSTGQQTSALIAGQSVTQGLN